MDLIIDTEFKQTIPPLRPDELTELEQSLIKEGCRDALVIWAGQNILLDALPGLEERYTKWAAERQEALGLEKLGIEYAGAIFFEETMNLPAEDKERVTEAACKRAKELFQAFRSNGTGAIVRKYLAS